MTMAADGTGAAWKALEGVRDPEFPVSVVALGLVRDVEVVAGTATVRLTYTSMGCPWTDWIERDIRTRLLEVPQVERVEIDVVWDHTWSRKDVREDARRRLKELGIV